MTDGPFFSAAASVAAILAGVALPAAVSARTLARFDRLRRR